MSEEEHLGRNERLLSGFWSREVENCLNNAKERGQFMQEEIAEALGQTAFSTKDQAVINAVAKAIDSYHTFPLGLVPTLFIDLAKKGIGQEEIADIVKQMAAVLEKTGPGQLSDGGANEKRYGSDPDEHERDSDHTIKTFQTTLGTIETTAPNRFQVGIHIAHVIKVMSERIDETQLLLSVAKCMEKYAESDRFYLIRDLFKILTHNGRYNRQGADSYGDHWSEIVRMVAVKYVQEKTAKSFDHAEESELVDWIYDGFGVRDNHEIKIYFLNPPSEKLAVSLKGDPNRARAIEETCQAMAFDPDAEKRF